MPSRDFENYSGHKKQNSGSLPSKMSARSGKRVGETANPSAYGELAYNTSTSQIPESDVLGIQHMYNQMNS